MAEQAMPIARPVVDYMPHQTMWTRKADADVDPPAGVRVRVSYQPVDVPASWIDAQTDNGVPVEALSLCTLVRRQDGLWVWADAAPGLRAVLGRALVDGTVRAGEWFDVWFAEGANASTPKALRANETPAVIVLSEPGPAGRRPRSGRNRVGQRSSSTPTSIPARPSATGAAGTSPSTAEVRDG